MTPIPFKNEHIRKGKKWMGILQDVESSEMINYLEDKSNEKLL